MNVELVDGNVENITRFKLLLPAARYGANEVFTAIFLKQLGFLAPRTFIKGKINGFTGNYIFQEDLRKEFLENSGLKEGPILEGDERFTVALTDNQHLYENKTNLSKLANKAYAKKSFSNLRVALDSVSNLNQLYILNHKANYPENFNKNVNLYLFTKYFFQNIKTIENLEVYEALVYALDAAHSLSYDDRRFYYDAFNKSFLPIYYDGKSKILEKNQITKNEELINNSSSEAKRGSEKALKKVSNINFNLLLKELNDAGLKIEKKDLRSVILNISSRLNILKNSVPPKILVSNKEPYFFSFNNTETRNKKLVFVNIDNQEFTVCDFKLENCSLLKSSSNNFNEYLADALNQDFDNFKKNFKIKSDLIFVHKDIYFENKSLKINSYDSGWRKIKIENSVILLNDYMDLRINKDEKNILFSQINKEGIALIKNGKLENWSIKFKGYGALDNKVNENVNHFNLTGCLNFFDLKLIKTSFYLENSNCEDAINFIKTEGNINEIIVNNSVSDGVDMDFSNLQIKNISIYNSLNDCLDLSYGDYSIHKLVVNNCGDKGLSVGEKSKLKVDIFNSDKTEMAVASKDSSNVNLNITEIKNTKLCFAAYRKKQEFAGGKIVISSSNCNKDNIYYSKGSQIVFLK